VRVSVEDSRVWLTFIGYGAMAGPMVIGLDDSRGRFAVDIGWRRDELARSSVEAFISLSGLKRRVFMSTVFDE
jgi:hypothetical protein